MNSHSSSDSTLLDQKRSRHHTSITDSENSLDLSVSDFITTVGQSSGDSFCKTSTPSVTPVMATATNISVDQIQQVLDKLLVKRLREHKEEIIQEIKATVSDELDEMRGEIQDLKNENAELKKRVDHLEAASL